MDKSINSYYGIADKELKRAKTYLRFAAENDDYNGVASTCSQACEKFMKAYIEHYCNPTSVDIMRTHNLKKLAKFINEHIESKVINEIEYSWVGNFYFDSRYPGASYVEVDSDEAIKCVELTDQLKEWIDSFSAERKPFSGLKSIESFL